MHQRAFRPALPIRPASHTSALSTPTLGGHRALTLSKLGTRVALLFVSHPQISGCLIYMCTLRRPELARKGVISAPGNTQCCHMQQAYYAMCGHIVALRRHPERSVRPLGRRAPSQSSSTPKTQLHAEARLERGACGSASPSPSTPRAWAPASPWSAGFRSSATGRRKTRFPSSGRRATGGQRT
jgi:hypothetical protein